MRSGWYSNVGYGRKLGADLIPGIQSCCCGEQQYSEGNSERVSDRQYQFNKDIRGNSKIAARDTERRQRTHKHSVSFDSHVPAGGLHLCMSDSVLDFCNLANIRRDFSA